MPIWSVTQRDHGQATAQTKYQNPKVQAEINVYLQSRCVFSPSSSAKERLTHSAASKK